MKKIHNKKMIAPIIIVICLVLVILVYFVVPIIMFGVSMLLRAALIIGLIAVIAVAIHVLRDRIKEIRSGKEDDLGKY